MKSDREYIEGIYKKVKELQNQQEYRKPVALQLRRLVGGVAAAIILLIMTPVVFNMMQPAMKVPEGHANNEHAIMRINELINVTWLAGSSDLIVEGSVTKILNSEYVTDDAGKKSLITKVILKPKEILKGKTDYTELSIIVMGGFDEKNNVYEEYEALFKTNEQVVLFLYSKGDGSFGLANGKEGKLSKVFKVWGEPEYRAFDGSKILLSKIRKILIITNKLKKEGI